MSLQNEFSKIYKSRVWKADETVSGPNSMMVNAQSAIDAIDYCISVFKIKSILDIGCGDFVWMNQLMDRDVVYTGVDIVPELIQDNKEKYQGIDFRVLNVVEDSLPQGYDLILLRDVLIHLSLENISQVLLNLKNTDFKYLLSTTYSCETENIEMPKKRQMYHPLNLELPPISFAKPIKLFDNQTMVLKNSGKKDTLFVEGRYLGLWSKEDTIEECKEDEK